MKILSIAIPCYNSAAYMRRCIDSLLPGGEDVEILIVDDGSTKDNTAEIADEYEKNYPGIVKAIHQENGGHGEAVNAGLRNATGVYYKVVDSDDWVDVDVYLDIINTLERTGGRSADCRYVHQQFCLRQGRCEAENSDAVQAMSSERVFPWEEWETTAPRPLHPDAFRDLPYQAFCESAVWNCRNTPFTWTTFLCSSRFRT